MAANKLTPEQEYQREYQREYRLRNKEKLSAEAKRRYSEDRERVCEKSARYRAEHPEKNRATIRDWEARNRDKVRDSKRKNAHKNRETKRKYNRIYRALNREKRRLKLCEWRATHPEEAKALARKWKAEHPEQSAAAFRKWYDTHPEEDAARKRTRRARKLAASGFHTPADIGLIFETQGGQCATCKVVLVKKGKGRYHIDHVMPLSLGGSDGPENLQLLCVTCNLRKGSKHPDEWAKVHGRLFV